jgi:hypothetical protein
MKDSSSSTSSSTASVNNTQTAVEVEPRFLSFIFFAALFYIVPKPLQIVPVVTLQFILLLFMFR